MERLQKVIAKYGYASRREAEKLITSKKVRVNGELITELGVKVDANDTIAINGTVINKEIVKKYYLLYKPRGVVSTTSDEHSRKCVTDFVPNHERVYPIGRLDYDTTGLILLTNDGEFANLLMHPSNKITKTYVAKINGVITADAVEQLKKGVVVEDRRVKIVNFKVRKKDRIKNSTLIELTIIEGRNHIVKKLFEKLGFEVLKLTRTRLGHLGLDNMKSGDYRELSIKEVKIFYAEKNRIE